MKQIIAAALLLMLVMPFTVQAHTALSSSNPAQGEVLAENPEELELVFGTTIEEGSTMTLKGLGTDVALDNISISENVMKGLIAEELGNGQYIISWKIIGKDGHPIDGEVQFSLDAEPAEKAAPEEPAKEAAAEVAKEEPAAEQPAAASSEKQTAADDETEGAGVLTILLVVAIAVLIGFGSILLIKKKR